MKPTFVKKPFWLKLLMPWAWNSAVTLGLTVYVPASSRFWQFPPGDPKMAGFVAHEWAHSRRQESEGIIEWLFKYTFSRTFRLAEELYAIKHQMMAMVENSFPLTLDWINTKARFLSSWSYFKMVSYETARIHLFRIRTDIIPQ